MKTVSRKAAAAVTSVGTDIDHQRREVYLAFSLGRKMGPVVLLDYERLKALEDYCRKARQCFDHAQAIAKERAQRYVDPKSIATVD